MNCLLCNRLLEEKLSLREIIWPIKITHSPICRQCHANFVPCSGQQLCKGCMAITEDDYCQQCQQWYRQYKWQLRNHALYRYNLAMKDYMHRYKFMGDYRLRMAFQQEMAKAIHEINPTIVVPIPINEQTWQTRGFNQVEGLLEGLSVQPILATRFEVKQAQSSKSREERLKTIQPFNLIKLPENQQGKILLVDDIYTTGRTLYHAAVLFHQAGYHNVESLSLAR